MTFAWWNLAECRGVGSEMFFEQERWPEAEKLCSACPAKSACRDTALHKTRKLRDADEADLDFGFFAGMTPKMRLRALDELSQYSQTEPLEKT